MAVMYSPYRYHYKQCLDSPFPPKMECMSGLLPETKSDKGTIFFLIAVNVRDTINFAF